MLGPRTLVALAIVWCGVAVSGLGMLAQYSAKAGAASGATDWPAGTSIDRPDDRYFLLVFVHPECSCSESTLEELNRLMAQCDGRLAATIVFVKPTGNDQAWHKTALWIEASRIVNAKLICDVGGNEAARFDATTSGQVFLFDPSGQIQFRGGMTAGRAHSGDNDGEDSIAEIISGGAPPMRLTPVYGCRLFDSALPQPRGQTCKH
jgi:hypothetical protein